MIVFQPTQLSNCFFCERAKRAKVRVQVLSQSSRASTASLGLRSLQRPKVGPSLSSSPPPDAAGMDDIGSNGVESRTCSWSWRRRPRESDVAQPTEVGSTFGLGVVKDG